MNERPKILIVDDEPFNVDYLEQELEDLDYDTITATNGLEALDRVADDRPDLMLLDIMMPQMDGFAVLKHLKADPATRDLPVVIISAMNDIQSIARGIGMGAEDFLPKPFDPVLLRARIEALLEKKRLRDLELEYLYQVRRLTNAAAAIEEGTFEPKMLSEVAKRGDALGKLACVFQRMAYEIAAREQRLQEEVRELRIEIDKTRQAREVAEITETDYFQHLRTRARNLRASLNRPKKK